MESRRKLEEVILNDRGIVVRSNILKVLAESENHYVAYYESDLIGRKFLVDKSDVYREGDKLRKNSGVYYILYEEESVEMKKLKYKLRELRKHLNTLKANKVEIERLIEKVQNRVDQCESSIKKLGGNTNGFDQTYSEKTV